jgi:hypothetical protein
MDADSSNVFHSLSDAVQSMDAANEENQRLHSDVEFTKAEVARLRALVEAAAYELSSTQHEVEVLALKREDMERNSIQNTIYKSIQETEEANRTIQLERETQQILQRSILQETSAVAAEVELLRSQIGEDGTVSSTFQSSAGDLAYIKNLEAAVAAQNSEINRTQFNKEQLERDEAQMEQNEREILQLRQTLESCGLDVPVAPMLQRATLLRRRRERTAAAAGGAPLRGDNVPPFLSNFVAASSPSHEGGPSMIRPNWSSASGHIGSFSTGARKTRSRSFEVPCGWLQPLTTVLGPVRKLAGEYSLERIHMGSQPLDDHVVWLRPQAANSVVSTSSQLPGIGTQHQKAPATFLHAHGPNAELDRFEQQFLNAMEKASRLVARYDGLVTYTQSFGAQQQDETAQKLLNLVVSGQRHIADPSDDGMTVQIEAPLLSEGGGGGGGDYFRSGRHQPHHTTPPVSSTSQRRVTVATTPSHRRDDESTPMTIAGEDETP